MSQNNYLNKKTRRDKTKENKAGEDKIKKEKENKEEMMKDNIIIGYINVKKNKLRQRIINSEEKENEEEIKDCEIFINDKKIDFTYYYEFSKEGNYIIKYLFCFIN